MSIYCSKGTRPSIKDVRKVEKNKMYIRQDLWPSANSTLYIYMRISSIHNDVKCEFIYIADWQDLYKLIFQLKLLICMRHIIFLIISFSAVSKNPSDKQTVDVISLPFRIARAFSVSLEDDDDDQMNPFFPRCHFAIVWFLPSCRPINKE